MRGAVDQPEPLCAVEQNGTWSRQERNWSWSEFSNAAARITETRS